MVFDLPAGGRRLIQRVDGYRATFVAGVQTYADGEPTGARPAASSASVSQQPPEPCTGA